MSISSYNSNHFKTTIEDKTELLYKHKLQMNNAIGFSLRALLRYFFLLFMIISILLPSGHVGPVNAKFVILCVVILLLPITIRKYSATGLLLFVLMSLWLIIWFIIGSINLGSIYMPWLESKAIFVTFIIPFIAYILLINKVISLQQILKTIIYASLSLAITKIALLFISIGFDIPFYLLVKYISIYFRAQIMTMHIAGPLYRYEVVADLLTPFAIFILLQRNYNDLVKVNKIASNIIVVILLFSVFMAYSRYVFFMTFISIFLASLSNKRLILYAIPFFAFGLFLLLFLGVNFHFITERFESSAVTVSDNIRIQELRALVSYYLHAPIFGHGLGSYVPTLIRDAKEKFSYELQWLSLLMQTGLLGLTFIILLMIIVAKNFIRGTFYQSKIDLFLLFLLWLSASLFNAYLFSSASGIIFTFFVAESYAIKQRVT